MTSTFKSNTMVAVTFGIMLLTSTAFCAMIGDFAPTTVGAKWVYSYYSDFRDLNVGWMMDSLTESITVTSKFLRGNDTAILLGVSERGRKVYDAGGFGIHTDTTATWNYTDTAVASGDSIVEHMPYRCPIFPFYNTHVITQDSLKKVLLDNDSIFCYGQAGAGGAFWDYYYQNIGLYSLYSEEGSNSDYRTQVNLISFNNQNISVAAKPFVSKPAARPTASIRHAVIILDGKQMRRNGIYYNVNGKRISSMQYHGILLEKIGNQ